MKALPQHKPFDAKFKEVNFDTLPTVIMNGKTYKLNATDHGLMFYGWSNSANDMFFAHCDVPKFYYKKQLKN